MDTSKSRPAPFTAAPSLGAVSAETAQRANKFPLLDSVMANLSEGQIRTLARKQMRTELRNAGRKRHQDEKWDDRVMRVTHKAQSHMSGDKAHAWSANLQRETGIDARTTLSVITNRYESIGDFVGCPS